MGQEAEIRDPDAGERLLDGIASFIGEYVVAGPEQIDAMTLIAAQTFALDVLPSTMRVLFYSDREASGKTSAMEVLGSLCCNPMDATGTRYALRAGLAANSTESGAPMTLTYDEIRTVFGEAGMAGGNEVGDIIRKGYRNGARTAWSVNRTRVEFSTYGTFLMTGLGTSVPRDVRSRCIAFEMEQGTPERYFSVREGEAEAAGWAESLAQWVTSWKPEIGDFRARGLHPKLEGRHLEVWEGCLAVAAAAGPAWLKRGLSAFAALALSAPDVPVLTPDQRLLRDLAGAVASPMPLEAGGTFAGGLTLLDELRRLDDYAGQSEVSLARHIGRVMSYMGYPTQQRRFTDRRVRGYNVADITAAWEKVRPAPAEDFSAAAEPVTIFETWDTDDEMAYEAEVVTDVTDNSQCFTALAITASPHVFATNGNGETRRPA